MKIGLNATCFNDRPSGANQRFVGIYTELIKQLPDAEFVIYEPSDFNISNWFDGAPNVSIRQTPIPSEGRINKLIKGFGYWQSAIKDEKFDIFESFNLPAIKIPSGKVLHTIHDIRGMHPEWGSIFKYIKYKFTIEDMLKKSDRIITVSESMKNEILSFYPDASISVVYNGFNASVYDHVSESDQQEFRMKYTLPSEFLLSVGHFEKRKNYLNLIDAVARLHDKDCPYNLLIIGNDSGEGKVMKEKIESMNLSSHVTILSGLTDLEVRCAYKLCSLFVFSSSYEGFGIPILEAMAADSPMVLSDIPVFREITEDQGVYFPYNDPDLIASAIDKVLLSDSEKNRLIQYGNKRVQNFSFQKLAMSIADVYKALI